MNNRRCSVVIYDVVPAGLGIENSTEILPKNKVIDDD
jgi:hypothetical protein